MKSFQSISITSKVFSRLNLPRIKKAVFSKASNGCRTKANSRAAPLNALSAPIQQAATPLSTGTRRGTAISTAKLKCSPHQIRKTRNKQVRETISSQ
jgi:hypothetical protein